MTGRIIAERVLYSGFTRLLRLDIDVGTGTVHREVEHHGDAAAVLPYDPERKVACVVELLRAPLLHRGAPAEHLEAPAGLVEPGESAEEAIRREAEEEVGLRLVSLEPVSRAYSSPGISTEAMQLYLAAYHAPDRIGAGGGLEAEHENITVRELPLAALWTALETGELTDMKTIVLLYALRHRRPGLFV